MTSKCFLFSSVLLSALTSCVIALEYDSLSLAVMMGVFLLGVNFLVIENMYWFMRVLMESPRQAKEPRLKSFVKKCTVILPVKNESEETILRAVGNLLSLRGFPDDIDILIIDNSSNLDLVAGIRSKLSHFKSVRFIHRRSSNQCPNGKAANLNAALRLISKPYFIIVDADSELPSDILLRSSYLLRNRDVAVVQFQRYDHTKSYATSPISAIRHLARDQVFEHWISPARFSESFPNFPGHNVILSVDAVRSVGGFDPQMLVEDSDLAIRLANHGYKLKYQFIPTGDGKIATLTSWISRSIRLVQGKTQIAFKWSLRRKHSSHKSIIRIAVIFHFGRFLWVVLALCSFFVFTLVDFSAATALLVSYLLFIAPGPLMPVSSLPVLLAGMYRRGIPGGPSFRGVQNLIVGILLLFLVSFLSLWGVIKCLLGHSGTFSSTQRE